MHSKTKTLVDLGTDPEEAKVVEDKLKQIDDTGITVENYVGAASLLYDLYEKKINKDHLSQNAIELFDKITIDLVRFQTVAPNGMLSPNMQTVIQQNAKTKEAIDWFNDTIHFVGLRANEVVNQKMEACVAVLKTMLDRVFPGYVKKISYNPEFSTIEIKTTDSIVSRKKENAIENYFQQNFNIREFTAGPGISTFYIDADADLHTKHYSHFFRIMASPTYLKEIGQEFKEIKRNDKLSSSSAAIASELTSGKIDLFLLNLQISQTLAPNKKNYEKAQKLISKYIQNGGSIYDYLLNWTDHVGKHHKESNNNLFWSAWTGLVSTKQGRDVLYTMMDETLKQIENLIRFSLATKDDIVQDITKELVRNRIQDELVEPVKFLTYLQEAKQLDKPELLTRALELVKIAPEATSDVNTNLKVLFNRTEMANAINFKNMSNTKKELFLDTLNYFINRNRPSDSKSEFKLYNKLISYLSELFEMKYFPSHMLINLNNSPRDKHIYNAINNMKPNLALDLQPKLQRSMSHPNIKTTHQSDKSSPHSHDDTIPHRHRKKSM